MSNPLKVSFADFWFDFDPEDNFLLSALESIGPVKVVRHRPDILFYSVFGTRNLGFIGKKVLVNPEVHSQGFGRPNFSISYHEASNPTLLRLPIWAWHSSPELLVPSSDRFPVRGEFFCNFIYSNQNCEFRNRFFVALNRRKPVDSLGAAFSDGNPRIKLDNRASSSWQSSKREVLSKFRFTISFENISSTGYSTEKIADAFLSGSVPIYWGDPFIGEDFNSKAFISAHDFTSYLDLIERVIEVENDNVLLDQYRSEPPMSREQYGRYFNGQLESFLRHCVSHPRDKSSKLATRSLWGMTTKLGQPAHRNPLFRVARKILR